MSYGFDLVRLPSGMDRDAAYRKVMAQQGSSASGEGGKDHGPLNPDKEQAKQTLAAALMAKYPSLKKFERNYAILAKEQSIDESEARRLYRDLELNDEKHSVQIILFDDAAGVSFSDAPPGECRQTVQALWDCLTVLETQGGFSTFDPQQDRLLDLSTDFESVLKQVCGSS
jgi:hypothetical protein